MSSVGACSDMGMTSVAIIVKVKEKKKQRGIQAHLFHPLNPTPNLERKLRGRKI